MACLTRQGSERLNQEKKMAAEENARREIERIESERRAAAETAARLTAELYEAEKTAAKLEIIRLEAERAEAEKKVALLENAISDAELLVQEGKAAEVGIPHAPHAEDGNASLQHGNAPQWMNELVAQAAEGIRSLEAHIKGDIHERSIKYRRELNRIRLYTIFMVFIVTALAWSMGAMKSRESTSHKVITKIVPDLLSPEHSEMIGAFDDHCESFVYGELLHECPAVAFHDEINSFSAAETTPDGWDDDHVSMIANIVAKGSDPGGSVIERRNFRIKSVFKKIIHFPFLILGKLFSTIAGRLRPRNRMH